MWPEVKKALDENRHELVLSGADISKRIEKGGLDPGIFNLVGLNYLDIHESSLSEIPDHISRIVNLQTLVLHSNKLTGFNVNLTKLEKLKLFDLSRNEIKEIPSDINNLTNIVTFNFAYNHLEAFPQLINTTKLSVLDLSNNKLESFPDICKIINLSELKLNDNEIEIIPTEIQTLSGLKVLELGHNKIKSIPGEVACCSKLKVLELKNNPISDRRLLKLIQQCHIKQIVDYIKAHCPKTIPKTTKPDLESSESDSENENDNYKYIIRIKPPRENTKIVVKNGVKAVREFLVACVVPKVRFTEDTFKKFIQIQNKLHDTVCSKRNSSTIATHDLDKIPPGEIQYTTLTPTELMIHPLNRTAPLSGADLFKKLQIEATNLRKEKKRNVYSGIHKYLYLIEGQPKFPCLIDSQNVVLSFPPITNSEVSKITPETKTMLVEVTSSLSLHSCKTAMEALLKELIFLMDKDLQIEQIKTVDEQGNLKVAYPAKTDLNFESGDFKIFRI